MEEATGIFYGIGVGPGDPGLLTLKGAKILGGCTRLFVPKARSSGNSRAFEIVASYVNPEAEIIELVFPMTRDKDLLEKRWNDSVSKVVAHLKDGEDVSYITLGDPFLYSTYIYLIKGLKKALPDLSIITVPGITSFGAAASLAGFPLGEGDEKIAIIPGSEDPEIIKRILRDFDTVIIMKVGEKLENLISILEQTSMIEDSVLVGRAGMPGEIIERDLRRLKKNDEKIGYLSTILVKGKERL